MNNYLFLIFPLFTTTIFSQSFLRSELPTILTTPWEIVYGPDGFLWISEKDGKISRVNRENGEKQVIYTAPDYFPGDLSEKLTLCHQPIIGAGTMGLALHPDFLHPDSSFVYLFYSYNAGNLSAPKTNFKIAQLTWDANAQIITNSNTILQNIPSGYDHLGGRLLAVKQSNRNFLYVSIGDHGISEDNSPGCYVPESANPNNFTQHVDSLNGKILRLNMDGSIPYDNPIAGNPMYTGGHRNPQGLVFNTEKNIIYDIEHGDRTDDELNLLEAGMNYGWKTIRGYPDDATYPNEALFFANYSPNPLIANDRLISPIHSWCTLIPPAGSPNSDWCTIAPSDGIYYGEKAIHAWNNSILVTTLKDGSTTDKSVHLLRLSSDGRSLRTSNEHPAHEILFAEDQALNGRLRDIAISPDGRTLFLINNGGTDRDKITVYRYNPAAELGELDLLSFPNPVDDQLAFISTSKIREVRVFDLNGKVVMIEKGEDLIGLNVSALGNGLYTLKAVDELLNEMTIRFVKK